LRGSVEVVLFPKDLERYQAMLKLESLAFFRGQVDRRREEPSLRVSEVIPLEQADEVLSTAVVLRINCNGNTEAALQKVREIVKQFNGPKPLYLELWTEGRLKVTLRANERNGVKPSEEFREAIEAVLGEHTVTIAGLVRRAPAAAIEHRPVPEPDEEMETAAADGTGDEADDEAVLAD
jgi:DNA polymerase-3 subunit alpha